MEGLVQGLLTALILALIAMHLGSSWRRWQVEEWARSMRLELTPRNRTFVRSYIRRTRILRTGCGVAGLLTPVIYMAFVGEPIPQPFDFGLLNGLVGYLVGAVVAELLLKRPKAMVPTAALVPRDLRDYLPSALTITLRATAAAGLMLLLIYLSVPERVSRSPEILPPWMVMVSMILLILVGIELLQRYIVGRPQSAVEGDLVQADDAVRSASLHALAGAGIALELIIVGAEIAAVGTIIDIQLLRWVLPWIGLACGLVALGSWMHVSRPDHWQVRRTHHGATA
ncbi:MAG: hypothetical protein H0W27_00255 [Actinobacteria bacterium]|nr:hypothetical protein [Actinomycetota bacterium]